MAAIKNSLKYSFFVFSVVVSAQQFREQNEKTEFPSAFEHVSEINFIASIKTHFGL